MVPEEQPEEQQHMVPEEQPEQQQHMVPEEQRPAWAMQLLGRSALYALRQRRHARGRRAWGTPGCRELRGQDASATGMTRCGRQHAMARFAMPGCRAPLQQHARNYHLCGVTSWSCLRAMPWAGARCRGQGALRLCCASKGPGCASAPPYVRVCARKRMLQGVRSAPLAWVRAWPANQLTNQLTNQLGVSEPTGSSVPPTRHQHCPTRHQYSVWIHKRGEAWPHQQAWRQVVGRPRDSQLQHIQCSRVCHALRQVPTRVQASVQARVHASRNNGSPILARPCVHDCLSRAAQVHTSRSNGLPILACHCVLDCLAPAARVHALRSTCAAAAAPSPARLQRAAKSPEPTPPAQLQQRPWPCGCGGAAGAKASPETPPPAQMQQHPHLNGCSGGSRLSSIMASCCSSAAPFSPALPALGAPPPAFPARGPSAEDASDGGAAAWRCTGTAAGEAVGTLTAKMCCLGRPACGCLHVCVPVSACLSAFVCARLSAPACVRLCAPACMHLLRSLLTAQNRQEGAGPTQL